MKKNICFLMLMLLGIHLTYAQEESSSFRLELSTQSIFSLGPNSEESSETDFYTISKKRYNYSLHLSGFWDISKRLELGVGAGFSNRDAYFGINCNSCIGPIRRPGDPVASNGSYVRRRNIEIPVELRLNWFKDPKVIDPFVAFGLTNKFPLTYWSVMEEEKTLLELGKYGIGFSLLVGTKVKLGERWGLVSSVGLTRNKNYVLESNSYTPNIDLANQDTKNELWIKLGIRRSFR